MKEEDECNFRSIVCRCVVCMKRETRKIFFFCLNGCNGPDESYIAGSSDRFRKQENKNKKKTFRCDCCCQRKKKNSSECQ